MSTRMAAVRFTLEEIDDVVVGETAYRHVAGSVFPRDLFEFIDDRCGCTAETECDIDDDTESPYRPAFRWERGDPVYVSADLRAAIEAVQQP